MQLNKRSNLLVGYPTVLRFWLFPACENRTLAFAHASRFTELHCKRSFFFFASVVYFSSSQSLWPLMDCWEVVVMLPRWNVHYNETLTPLQNSNPPVTRGIAGKTWKTSGIYINSFLKAQGGLVVHCSERDLPWISRFARLAPSARLQAAEQTLRLLCTSF